MDGTLRSSSWHQRIAYYMAHRLLLAEPYDPQRQCVQDILHIFQEHVVHYVLLRAPLQSGKTGTYQYLIRMMLSLGFIDVAYVVCGSHEIELRNQVEADIKEWHGEGALGTTVHVVFRQHFRKTEMATHRVLIVNDESHLDCEKGQELEHFLSRHSLTMAGTTHRMIRDNVYMVSVSATPFAEESVLAHGDSLPKAIVRLAVDASYYGPAEYYRDGLLREAYTVQTEEGKLRFRADIQRTWERNKYVLLRLRESDVEMDKGKKGKEKAKKKGKKDKKDKEKAEKKGKGNEEKKALWTLLQQIVKETPGARILHFTSKYDGVNQEIALTADEAQWKGKKIPSLDTTPDVPTVVLLDGRLRCGKRIIKTHIGMTWDTAGSSRTDVILQGLVGRMCGYVRKEDDVTEKGQVPFRLEDRPVLYTTPILFATVRKKEEERATVKLSDLERFDVVQRGVWNVGVEEKEGLGQWPLVTPRHANHLRQGGLELEMRNKRGVVVHQCAPLRFVLPPESIQALGEGNRTEMKDAELRRLCWNAFLPRMGELVDVCEALTFLQKLEIQEWMERHGPEDAHVRRYCKDRANGYKHMVEAHRAQRAVEKDRITGGNMVTFCVVFEGFEARVPEDSAGTVYVSFFTEAEGFLRVVPLSSRIPHHDGKTHFVREEVEEVEEVERAKAEEDEKVGVASYGFTSDIIVSPAALETQLDFFLRIARHGIGQFGRRFTGIQGSKGIPLLLDAYGGDRLPLLHRALRRIEQTHSVTIQFQRRVRWNDCVYLKWLEWTPVDNVGTL